MHYRTLSLETVVATTIAARASEAGPGSPGGHVAAPFPWGRGEAREGSQCCSGTWQLFWSQWVKPRKWEQNPPRSPLVHFTLVDSWCRVLGFKAKTKTWGFESLFKRYSKDRPHLLKERRATGLLIGVWVCSALQEFKFCTLEEGNVFVQKPWIMVLLLKWPARWDPAGTEFGDLFSILFLI